MGLFIVSIPAAIFGYFWMRAGYHMAQEAISGHDSIEWENNNLFEGIVGLICLLFFGGMMLSGATCMFMPVLVLMGYK
jgi:hypothetical protein